MRDHNEQKRAFPMGFITGLLKFVAGLIVLIAVIVAITLTAARFADGPWAVITGGPFTTGTPSGVPDAIELTDRQEVEFQLVESGTSRTTWIMQANGRLFIPSGYMNSLVGAIWKHWPYDAEQDGRIILRVDDKLYNMTMQRIMQDPDLNQVLSEIARKYGTGFGSEVPEDQVTSGDLWIFELIPRS